MNIKIETWAGHKIRFIEKDNEWWAVAKDVALALDYSHAPHMIRRLNKEDVSTVRLSDGTDGNPNISIISEFGIYESVFGSKKSEAKEFKKWVYEVLRTLRQSTGLEGFQIFRMLDKEHQKYAMATLKNNLRKPIQKHFIKANTIANKAVSNMYGYSKMVKKEEMTPEMLVDRQPILDDAVNLMGLADKYNLDISVSQTIYGGLVNQKTG